MLLIDSRNRPRRFLAQINERSMTHRFISIAGNSGNPSSLIESFFEDGTTLISTLIPFFRKSNTLRPMLLEISIIWEKERSDGNIGEELKNFRREEKRSHWSGSEHIISKNKRNNENDCTIDWSRRFCKDSGSDSSWSLHRWLGFVPRSGGSPNIKSQSISILALCPRSSNLSLLCLRPIPKRFPKTDFHQIVNIVYIQ